MQSHKSSRPLRSKKQLRSRPSSLHSLLQLRRRAKTASSVLSASTAGFSISLNAPEVKKHIPPPLSTPAYKGSILNKHHNLDEDADSNPQQQKNTPNAYDSLIFDKHNHVTSNPITIHAPLETYEIDEELYDQTTISALKSQIVTKPIDQMKPLINVLLPKDAVLDQFSYLRIRKIAKNNPDLLQMNENKLSQRLSQLSKVVLHPSFYQEYSQRYVYQKHNIPPTAPSYSSLTDDVYEYLADKSTNLENGINAPNEAKELHIRSYKKLHQYPYHPLVLHVFERYPLILRRKHIENSPELITQLFSDLNNADSFSELHDITNGRKGGVENLFQSMNEFNDNVVPPPDDPEFGYKSPFHISWRESSPQSQTGNSQAKEHKNGQKAIDAHAILGRFPKLLQFDLTNRLHHKIDSFTTILCTFLAQDAPLHDGIYTRDSISRARQQVLQILATQPDILQSNIYNTIPKRLDFIQKACLFNNAQDTIDYILENPRLLTIPPSSLQRLSLLRLKPPRFTDINPDQWAKLGFEQKFALDMVKRIANLTPYPSLSQELVENMKYKLEHGKGQNNRRYTQTSPSMDEYNQQETLYDQYDMSWAEYLESAAPASKYDADSTNIAKKMGLKADIIPLLTMMHSKTFNVIFGEFVEAKKRSNVAKGVYHGTQQQQRVNHEHNQHEQEQYKRINEFLSHPSAENEEFQTHNPVHDEHYDIHADFIPSNRNTHHDTDDVDAADAQPRRFGYNIKDDSVEIHHVNRHVSNKAPRERVKAAEQVHTPPPRHTDATDGAKPRIAEKFLRRNDPMYDPEFENSIDPYPTTTSPYLADEDREIDPETGIDLTTTDYRVDNSKPDTFFNSVSNSELKDLHFRNSADHAPAREIHLFGKNKHAYENDIDLQSDFYKSDLKVHARDLASNKLHRYKGKGSQFGDNTHKSTDLSSVHSHHRGEIDATDNIGVLNQPESGTFGVKVSKKMFADLGKDSHDHHHNTATTDSEDPEHQLREQLDRLDAAQRKYVHKNKLQKIVAQKRRRDGQHDEEVFMDQLQHQYGQNGEFIDNLDVIPTTVSGGVGKHSGRHGHIDAVTEKMSQSDLPRMDQTFGHVEKVSITDQLAVGKQQKDLAMYDVDFDLDAEMTAQAVSLKAGTQQATQEEVRQDRHLHAQSVNEAAQHSDEKHGKKTASSRPKGTGRKAPEMDAFESKWSGGARSGKAVL